MTGPTACDLGRRTAFRPQVSWSWRGNLNEAEIHTSVCWTFKKRVSACANESTIEDSKCCICGERLVVRGARRSAKCGHSVCNSHYKDGLCSYCGVKDVTDGIFER
jgi:hypothetical protein